MMTAHLVTCGKNLALTWIIINSKRKPSPIPEFVGTKNFCKSGALFMSKNNYDLFATWLTTS